MVNLLYHSVYSIPPWPWQQIYILSYLKELLTDPEHWYIFIRLVKKAVSLIHAWIIIPQQMKTYFLKLSPETILSLMVSNHIWNLGLTFYNDSKWPWPLLWIFLSGDGLICSPHTLTSEKWFDLRPFFMKNRKEKWWLSNVINYFILLKSVKFLVIQSFFYT